jgi:peroxiredoxin (alkyl hydroperoxide reductase subunit C)
MENQFYLSEVKVGRKVENFTAQAVLPSGEFGGVSLENVMNDGMWTVLFFWPKDFTFVCPTEIRAISDAYEQFQAENIQVFGISTDTVHCHKAWRNQPINEGGIGEIKFPMLEDANHAISEQFGVLIEEEGVALRGTFIISPEGVLESATINNLSVGRSVEEILRTVAAFQSGGLCSMNWSKGDTNL